MQLAIKLNDIKKYTKLADYKLIRHQKRKKCIIKLVQSIAPAESTILDIGSANGDLATELSILNYKVEGIEPLKESFNRALNLSRKYKQKINIKNAYLEDINENNEYDLIIMGEILEHFHQPEMILNKLKRRLRPDGKILITVPNAPSLRNRLKFGILGIFPDNNPEHKYYFDHKRLVDICAKCGYSIAYFKTKYTNLVLSRKFITHLENITLFWFSKLFKYSGDALIAVIAPNGNST